MNLKDALYNWLQMKIVSEARPDDQAALDTMHFFEEIVKEDKHCESFDVKETEDTYQIRYSVEGNEETYSVPKESADQLLIDINSNPKYNE